MGFFSETSAALLAWPRTVVLLFRRPIVLVPLVATNVADLVGYRTLGSAIPLVAAVSPITTCVAYALTMIMAGQFWTGKPVTLRASATYDRLFVVVPYGLGVGLVFNSSFTLLSQSLFGSFLLLPVAAAALLAYAALAIDDLAAVGRFRRGWRAAIVPALLLAATYAVADVAPGFLLAASGSTQARFEPALAVAVRDITVRALGQTFVAALIAKVYLDAFGRA